LKLGLDPGERFLSHGAAFASTEDLKKAAANRRAFGLKCEKPQKVPALSALLLDSGSRMSQLELELFLSEQNVKASPPGRSRA
jgi:hypothetical protein